MVDELERQLVVLVVEQLLLLEPELVVLVDVAQ